VVTPAAFNISTVAGPIPGTYDLFIDKKRKGYNW